MRNSTTKDKSSAVELLIDPKRTVDPEGVFNDSAVMIDYLNSMLISTPQPSLDFGDIRYIHQPMDDNAIYGSTNSSLVDNFFNFESERLKLETKTLRSENDELKLKVARLVAQLNETECNLDTVTAENSTLKARTDYLQNQLKISDKIAKNATRRLQAAKSSIAKKANEAKSAPILEPANLAAVSYTHLTLPTKA